MFVVLGNESNDFDERQELSQLKKANLADRIFRKTYFYPVIHSSFGEQLWNNSNDFDNIKVL